MTFYQFLTESQYIFQILGSIVNSIPSIILDILFTAVAFSVVIAIVNMVRNIRS